MPEILELFSFLFLFMYTHMHLSMQRPEKGVGFIGPGVTDRCDQAYVDAGNQAQVFCS